MQVGLCWITDIKSSSASINMRTCAARKPTKLAVRVHALVRSSVEADLHR